MSDLDKQNGVSLIELRYDGVPLLESTPVEVVEETREEVRVK